MFINSPWKRMVAWRSFPFLLVLVTFKGAHGVVESRMLSPMCSKQLNDRLKENQMKLLCLIASSFELFKSWRFWILENDQKTFQWKMVGFFWNWKSRRNKKPGTAERFRLKGCSTGDWPESRFRKPEMTWKWSPVRNMVEANPMQVGRVMTVAP